MYRTAAHLPGFASDQLSAAAIAASVVEDGSETTAGADRSPALLDLDARQLSRAGAVRRAPESLRGGADAMDSDDEWEAEQEQLRGYSSEARWARLHRGLEAVRLNLPRLHSRAEQSEAELLEMKQTLRLTGALQSAGWGPADLAALRSVEKEEQVVQDAELTVDAKNGLSENAAAEDEDDGRVTK